MIKRLLIIAFLLITCKFGCLQAQMVLFVDNQNDGIARLSWNTCTPNTNTEYIIMRQRTGGSWEELGRILTDLNTITYADSIYVCDEEIKYRIDAPSTACLQSNEELIRIVDLNPPSMVQIQVISVNPDDGWTEFSWDTCASPDTKGYRILREIQSVAYSHDTIYGKENTSYRINEADTNVLYRVAAIDSCYTSGPLSRSRQIFVSAGAYYICENRLLAYWSPPDRALSNVSHLELWISEDDQSYQRVSVTTSNEDYLEHFISPDVQKLVLYLKAFNTDGSLISYSKTDTLFVEKTPRPDYNYIRNLSVDETGNIAMFLHVDDKKPWGDLLIYEDEELLRSVPYKQPFTDTVWSFPLSFKMFRVELTDTCNNVVDTSNRSKVVRLDAQLSGQNIDLSWSAYEGWLGGAEKYLLYRVKNDDTSLVADLAAGSPSYQWSDIQTDIDVVSSLWYYVEAIEASGNTFGFKETSYSNKVVVKDDREIAVYFPTGFRPDGISPEYKPIYAYQFGDKIAFYIYNKFGQLVFSTTEYDKGWDGRFNGQEQPVGGYVYTVIIERRDIKVQKQGTFILVR